MSQQQTPQDPDALLDANVRVPDHVVFRAFVAETVMLNLQTGKYHGVNPTGGRMLEVLEQGRTPREVAAQLANEFSRPEAEVQADIVEFLRDLLTRDLVQLEVQGDREKQS